MVSRIRGLGMEVSCLQQLHTLPVHTACQYLALLHTTFAPHSRSHPAHEFWPGALDLEYQGAEHQNLKQ